MNGKQFAPWIVASALVLGGSVSIAVPPTSGETERVQKDVEQVIRALYSGDVGTVVGYTHPLIIKLQGGEEAVRATVSEAHKTMSKLGMKVESLSFPRSPDFLEGGGRRFVVVPTLLRVVANGQPLESLNFQLGILEAGSKKWSYVEGSRINRENVKQLFPGFPVDYEFPPTYRKKL